MFKTFQSVLRTILRLTNQEDTYPFLEDASIFKISNEDQLEISRALNAAFLIALSGEDEPSIEEARSTLQHMTNPPGWKDVASFYLQALDSIPREINSLSDEYPNVAHRLESLSSRLEQQGSQAEISEIIEDLWSFTHPEAAGIWSHKKERIDSLRAKRKVSIADLNEEPIRHPARQILFTANALLTLPSKSNDLEELSLSESLKNSIASISKESQVYWYDHPIQIGVEPERNEVLYGLRGLQQALDFERTRGNIAAGDQLTCVLSVSVTHDGLHKIARQYLEEQLNNIAPLPGLKVFAFTETDTRQLIEEVLAPAAQHYLGEKQAPELLSILGVDGEYGRHYTFLKAIAAFWSVLIDPQIEATFKIDLDQVFPQETLVEETGLSAFEHFRNPLWGATGLDADNEPVELGMIAGALVNENDIEGGLFTPDVTFPPAERSFSLDELVFFSQLPQALSTQAEMMARYNTEELDGVTTCLQRVHVTGGTTGILVDSLRRYRPFTPSFIGRAEDQAYVFSTFSNWGTRLAYIHQAGLIMRHDKKAFAQDAIQAAQVGKLIGDYVRTLYFSAYAQIIDEDTRQIKKRVDPFTGSFISNIPITLTLLRFAMKAEALFTSGETQLGNEFVRMGSLRLGQAIQFAYGDADKLNQQYQHERHGWKLYYEILSVLENGLQEGDPLALEMQKRAQDLINRIAITQGS